MWDLCREPCLLWFVRTLKQEYLGKKEIFKEFNIKDKVNHYESWTFSWIKGVSEWLQEVTLDTALVCRPLEMTRMCHNNEEFKTVYKTFLLLLYWLELKQSVRDRQIDRLIRLAPCVYHVLRVSGHPKVAAQILLFIWQKEALPGDLFQALVQHSMGSISGA
jgi:hypothetical protein